MLMYLRDIFDKIFKPSKFVLCVTCNEMRPTRWCSLNPQYNGFYCIDCKEFDS